MRTEARRDGDEYVLDGSKRFITNAGVAQLYVVFAKTDPDAGHEGISAFVVEADTPGFEIGRIEPKMGIKGSTTGEVFFDGCRVPAANRLGEEGEGFALAMRILDRSRPGIAAQGARPRRRARPTTRSSTRGRARRWASRSRSHQLVAGMLADMETRCEAARGLLYRCGRADRRRAPTGPELTKLSAMTKLFCTDAAMAVTTDAVQVLGGYGYMQEYPVERMMRDAKITQIYEGTNQIQRLVIARELLREGSGAHVPRGQALAARDRVLFPDDGITKGDLFDYYERGRAGDRAAPARPAVHDEALARGAAGRGVLPEAGAEGHAGLDPDAAVPDLARARAGRGSSTSRSSTRADALLWMVQMHCIDMNAWYSRVDKPDRPDFVLFDLDPPDGPDGFPLGGAGRAPDPRRARGARARART